MTFKARRVVVAAQGGREAMQFEDVALPAPGPGEVLIRHEAVGLNFIDVYHRSGLYPMPVPTGIGVEAAGVIEAVGTGVAHLKPGDRAAYGGGPPGAYATARVMPAAPVVPLPDVVSFEDAAALMLKGLTVHYLIRRTARLDRGDWVLFPAAAGGVGLIACQWARADGLRLIGTASTEAKRQEALAAGAEIALDSARPDLAAEVKRITGGRGVAMVMDGVGADTWDSSLDSLRPFGVMASFGNASGKVPPVDLGVLAAKGSLMVTRPTLYTHIADPEVLRSMAADLFALVASGAVKADVRRRLPLADVAEAHRALEARETVGATVFDPHRPG